MVAAMGQRQGCASPSPGRWPTISCRRDPCGGSSTSGRIVAPRSPRLARWLAFSHVRRPLDLLAREDGRRVAIAVTPGAAPSGSHISARRA